MNTVSKDSHDHCPFVTAFSQHSGSGLISPVPCIRFPSFLRLNNIPLHIQITLCSIHSSVHACLGCIRFLAIVDNGAMDVGVKIFLWVLFLLSLDVYLDMKLLNYKINLYVNFLRNHSTVFQRLHHFTFPPTSFISTRKKSTLFAQGSQSMSTFSGSSMFALISSVFHLVFFMVSLVRT